MTTTICYRTEGYRTEDEMIEALAAESHRANLERGGVFHPDGEPIDPGWEVGHEGRTSSLDVERGAIRARVRFITHYTFIAKKTLPPKGFNAGCGIVVDRTIHYVQP